MHEKTSETHHCQIPVAIACLYNRGVEEYKNYGEVHYIGNTHDMDHYESMHGFSYTF